MKFNLPTIEELVCEQLKKVARLEELYSKETNPLFKKLMKDKLDLEKSYLGSHVEEIRHQKINQILSDDKKG